LCWVVSFAIAFSPFHTTKTKITQWTKKIERYRQPHIEKNGRKQAHIIKMRKTLERLATSTNTERLTINKDRDKESRKHTIAQMHNYIDLSTLIIQEPACITKFPPFHSFHVLFAYLFVFAFLLKAKER
jgi:hypothetical protein